MGHTDDMRGRSGDTSSPKERPGLTLVTGPANAGKMGRALDWWQARLVLRPVVVAPTVPDAEQLTADMVRRTGALVGVSAAVTFDGFMAMVSGRPVRRPSTFQRRLILDGLVSSVRLGNLGPAAVFPGTVDALVGLIDRLAEAGRPPAEMLGVLRRWGETDVGSRGLATDIVGLCEGYLEVCRRWGMADVWERTDEVTLSIEDWTRPVALYGFTSFTPGQRFLLEKLVDRVPVLITLPYEASRVVNLTSSTEVSRWRALASEVVELEAQDLAYTSPAIAYLERHLLQDPPLPDPPPSDSGPQGVRFVLASGQRNEAESAAQQVVRLVREGFHPGNIAVIVRRVRPWGGLLGQVFGSCGIPYHVDERKEVRETGFGYAFLAAVGAIVHDDPEALLAYMRSPYSDCASDAVAEVELRYRRANIRGIDALEALAEAACPGSVVAVRRVVTETGGGLRLVPDGLSLLAERMLTAGLRGLAPGHRGMEEDARAFRTVSAAIASLELLPKEDGERWLQPKLVMRVLAGTSVPAGSQGAQGAVQILGVQRARARRFDAVVLLGLVEGEFPGSSDAPSLLSSVQQRRIEALAGGRFLAPETEQEAALFVSAVSRAWQVLVLSARDTDDGGAEAEPSYLWRLSKQLLAVGDADHEHRTLAELVFRRRVAPSARHYLRACALDGVDPDPGLVGDFDRGPSCRWERPAADLAHPLVLAELERLGVFSPSALESYLSCPFRWFIERIIGIDGLEHELDGRLIGELLHRALSELFRTLDHRDALPVRPETLPAAIETALEIVADLVRSEDCPGSIGEKRLVRRRLDGHLRTLLEMEAFSAGTLVFSETEWEVGGREGVDVGGIRIRGRVDRIDLTHDGSGLFVIDYKSGTPPRAGVIGTSEALQLPLYLLALAAERPGARIIGGAYLGLRDGTRSGVVASDDMGLIGAGVRGMRTVDGEEFEEMYATVRNLAEEAAAGMRAGRIVPSPEGECPGWCDLGPVCRSRVGGRRP